MISLIVATVNRVTELERLLTSLEAQTFKDFEVIVVDQNLDDRLVPVLRRHVGLTLLHLRSERGVSKARNVGLRVARGEVIAVPDDDCWYPPELLASVTQWFEMHPEFDALFAAPRDEGNKLMAPKGIRGACRLTKENVWYCAGGTIAAFMRTRLTKAVGFFNEEIGPGTGSKYQSGEDIDYFIRPIKLGFQMWYEPGMTVYHPNIASIERLRRVTYGYALGVGYLLRMHGYSWWYFSKILARSLAGAGVYFCKGEVARAGTYLQRAAGQFQGYAFCPRDRRRSAESSTR